MDSISTLVSAENSRLISKFVVLVYTPPKCVKVALSPHSFQYLLPFLFLMMTILTRRKKHGILTQF